MVGTWEHCGNTSGNIFSPVAEPKNNPVPMFPPIKGHVREQAVNTPYPPSEEMLVMPSEQPSAKQWEQWEQWEQGTEIGVTTPKIMFPLAFPACSHQRTWERDPSRHTPPSRLVRVRVSRP